MSEFEGEQIQISEVFSILWRSKIKACLITSICVFISLLFAFLLPNIYKSEALLSVESSNQNSMSSMMSRYAGVASLAGVSLPSSASEDKSLLAIETIKSRDFLRHLLEDKKIKINLMAYDYYDAELSMLIIDSKIYDEEKHIWLKNSYYDYNEPTFLEVYEISEKIPHYLDWAISRLY